MGVGATPTDTLASMTGGGHAFISYVREDAQQIDAIERVLKSVGVSVWRDTQDLWPGEDWKVKIREAITDDALAFVACFSTQSLAREKTYQNEELVLAVEQYRQRQPNQPWLIPVRLDDCSMPMFDLGAGRTLDSLQRADLFGDERDEGLARLVATVLRIVAGHASHDINSAIAETSITFMKTTLSDATKQIALEDFVMGRANAAADKLNDPVEFPTHFPDGQTWFDSIRYVITQSNRYLDTLGPLIDALVIGSAWGRQEQERLWTLATERVANTAPADSGSTALLALRRLPVVALLYAAGMAAVHRRNFGALRAVAIDARFRERHGTLPLIAASHTWRPFDGQPVAATALALEADGRELTDETLEALRTRREGMRFTPVSDYLHRRLRKHLSPVIADDLDYTETFDQLEMLLAAVALDVQAHSAKDGPYPDGPWYGAYTWRSGRHTRVGPEEKFAADAQQAGATWPPLEGGLFGGSGERAAAAVAQLIEGSADARRHQL